RPDDLRPRNRGRVFGLRGIRGRKSWPHILSPERRGGVGGHFDERGLAMTVTERVAAPDRPAADRLDAAAALAVTVCCASWGATTVFIRATALKPAPPRKVLLYQLTISAAILPLVSYLMGEPGIMDLSPFVLAAFAYTVVVVAFASYVTWFWLVRNYPPTRVS